MTKNKAMYGISRIDDDLYRTHAWRVSIRRQGKLLVRNFPDKKFGGKRKAQQAAKQFRDEIIAKFPPTTRKQFCATVRRNNTSGIPGVYTYGKRYKLKDGSVRETRYWEAHWPVGENGSAKASFSYNTFGEKKAKQLAIQARKDGISRIKGVFWASKRGEIEEAERAASKAEAVTASTKKKAKVKKAPAAKSQVKKAAAKTTAKKAVASKAKPKKAIKTSATKAPAKAAAPRKSTTQAKVAAKKVAAKKPAVAKAAPKKQAVPKKTAPKKKVAPKKAATKKPAVAKATPKKPAALKKAAAKKVAVKKAAPKKAAAKKAPAKKKAAPKKAAKK